MRSIRTARARWAAWVTLAALACGDGAGPVGAPGGRDGLELAYATPRLRVVAAGEVATVRIALVVRRRTAEGAFEPLADARLAVEREEGRGQLSAAAAVTDADGLASVDVAVPGEADLTRVVFRMEIDSGSYLPFDVVSAPVVEADLAPGEVRDRADVPKSGALLRFRLEPGSDVLLIPYETDPDRAGATYRLLYQGSAPGAGASASGADPARLPQALAPSPEVGDVIEGAGASRGPLAPATIAESLDIQSCRIAASRKAPLRYLGSRVALYVDGPAGEDQARIDSIGRAFDERIFPRNTELFGITSDVDGNGVVIVILSPELDGVDGAYCDSIRRVGVEAFFVTWRHDYSVDQTLAVITHEHQHLVNAWHHAQTNGSVGDDRWLNEGLSFAAEALNGYWRDSLIRVWTFLNGQNGGLSMLPLDYASAFDDRYMALVLYVEDRFGPGALRALTQSGLRGVDNLEHVTGMPIEELLRDWFIAVGVSNRGWTDDPRYAYRSLDLHGMEETIAACRCVPVESFSGMRLEGLPLSSPFDVSRMLDRADADYYRLVPAATGPGTYDVYFDAFGREIVQLAMVRAR